MKTTIISTILPHLLNTLPDNVVKDGIDALLDKIEDAVAKSDTKLDDAIVLPLISMVRTSLDIPDNDA